MRSSGLSVDKLASRDIASPSVGPRKRLVEAPSTRSVHAPSPRGSWPFFDVDAVEKIVERPKIIEKVIDRPVDKVLEKMVTSPVLIEKVRSGVTDETGRYRIVDLRPGTYTLRLAATDAYGRVRTLTWIVALTP